MDKIINGKKFIALSGEYATRAAALKDKKRMSGRVATQWLRVSTDSHGRYRIWARNKSRG
jgi:hypothetical protein